MKNWFPFLLLLPLGVGCFFLPFPLGVLLYGIIFVLALGLTIFLGRKSVSLEKEPEESMGSEVTDMEIPREPETESPVEEEQDEIYQEETAEQHPQEDHPVLREYNHLKDSVHHVIQSIPAKGESNYDLMVKAPVDQISKTLSTVQGSVNGINSNVTQVFNISDNLSKNAKQAFAMADAMQKESVNIDEMLDKAIKDSNHLNDQSTEVSKIIEIMSEVSSQIHVLSINASIVSARAGDYGKGFEVVAKEIRSLAQNTDKSLETINQRIKDIQESIVSVVDQISHASQAIRDEQQTLVAVAGSLEGVLLGVEIINTVSTTARDMAQNQQQGFQQMESTLQDFNKNLQLSCQAMEEQMTQHKKLLSDALNNSPSRAPQEGE